MNTLKFDLISLYFLKKKKQPKGIGKGKQKVV